MHFVQNRDINATPKTYKHLTPDQLLVTSIFYTVQGEGPYAGQPAVFVRLAGCDRGRKDDMGCQFCDTNFKVSEGTILHFMNISLGMLNVCSGSPAWPEGRLLVVITGGEPMMQNNVSSFIRYLKRQGWLRFQIESNGDRIASEFPDDTDVKLLVSPKTVGSGYRDLDPDVFRRADFFKFVVEDDPASPYYTVPAYAHDRGGPVYISPLTVYRRSPLEGETASFWNSDLIDKQLTLKNYRHAAALALRYGFNLSMQQHLMFDLP